MDNFNHTSCRHDADDAAYLAAFDTANARALHSYFTQYILADDEAGYIALDEGDYGALPANLMARVIDSVPSRFSDEF
jgi:hypothetical protein